MKNILLRSFVILGAGTLMQAQWYFETGINDAKFTDYVTLSGTKTTLHSYSGLRDLSYSAGYLFPFKSLDKRAASGGIPSSIRLGVGIAYDQLNLRTRADIQNNQVPVTYNMGQAQGHLKLLFSKPLLKKQQPDALGVRRTAVNLFLEGGAAYSTYTVATRTFTANKGYVNDLKQDNNFDNDYLTYVFGGGFGFPLSAHTELYAKYDIEKPFSDTKTTNDTYRTVKKRVMLGLRFDLRLKNYQKKAQEEHIAALDAALEHDHPHEHEPVDLTPLYTKIEALEKKLEAPKWKFFPDFKHVLFPVDSSVFDVDRFGEQLSNLATFMIAHPNAELRLVGYADSKTGTTARNLELSKNRSKRVFDYLVSLGVSPDVMSHEGAGETLQFSQDVLPKNRRTELLILIK